MDFEVVIGLDLGVENTSTRKIEPKLHLIGQAECTLIVAHSLFQFDDGFGCLESWLNNQELFMAEIIGDDGVGLLREIGVGLTFG